MSNKLSHRPRGDRKSRNLFAQHEARDDQAEMPVMQYMPMEDDRRRQRPEKDEDAPGYRRGWR